MKLLMDTHIWYWFAIGDKLLAPKSVAMINDAALNDSLYVSAMSVWELAMLESKNRISFQLPTLQWIEEALNNLPLQLIPLTPAISVESCSLTHFHGDPADRIIVATARVEKLILLTRDQKILDYASINKIKAVAI